MSTGTPPMAALADDPPAQELVPARVLLVEDHALVRAAVRHAIDEAADLEVVGDLASAEQALERIPELQPDIVVIDLDLTGMSGMELVRQVAPHHPGIALVVLTVSKSESDLIDAVRAGARGFLSKDLSPEALVRALRAIRHGEMPLSRAHASLLIRRLAASAGASRATTAAPVAGLTTRENEVLHLLAAGMTDREISVSLGISRRTVESHVRNILEKLQVESRLQAARVYRTQE